MAPANHYFLELSRDSLSHGERSRVLPISAFTVEPSAEGPVIQTRDGELRFDAVEFIGEILSGIAVEMMKILPRSRHVPRITIDRLVICRESWTFSPDELPFIELEDEQEQFLEVRRWRHDLDLPRFVFVRVPVEVKPFYLDFDSPVYIGIFTKVLRRMAADRKNPGTVTITEMLPTADQLWLPDSSGNIYTCELRLVAVDQA